MIDVNKNIKTIGIIGLIVYSILILFSLYFYKERMTVLDDSFQLFEVIRKKSFAIQSYRFGEMFSQVFPLIGSLLGCSLKTCTQLYSLSFVLFPASCFFISLLYFKNEKIALVILLYNTLLVSHSFFWVICEVMHGVAFTLLYIAFVEHQIKNNTISKNFLIFSPLALVTIVFFYPLLFLVMATALFTLWLYYDKKNTKLLVGIFAAYLMIYILKFLFISSDYDQGAVGKAGNIITFFPNYHELPSFKIFYNYFINDYFVILIAFAIAALGLLIFRKFLQFSLLLTSVFGFFILLAIIYNDGNLEFYLEPQFTLFSIFIAFPLCYFVIPFVSKPVMVWLPLNILIALSIIKIYNTSSFYQQRVNWLRAVIKEMGKSSQQKIILKESEVSMNLLQLSWGAPTEIWLLSTIENNVTYSVLIEENPGEFDHLLNKKDVYSNKWGYFQYDELDPRYFKFTDTSSSYQHYSLPELH